ncbi:MAG: RING finger domain-containing protein [Oligoflexales bacterium]
MLRSYIHFFIFLFFFSSAITPPIFAHPNLEAEEELCAICIDPLSSEETIQTSCQHSFHKSCLKDYIGNNTKKHLVQYLFKANRTQSFIDHQDCQHECPLCRSLLNDRAHRDQFQFPTMTPNSQRSKLIFWYNGRYSGEIKRKWLKNKSQSRCTKDVDLIWEHIDKT